MPHLWIADRDGEWSALRLEETAYTLAEHPPRPLAGPLEPADPACRACLVPSRGADGTTWAVLATRPDHVHVGGRPVALGLRALADRDEIRVEGVGTMFFSTEALACVEPFPQGDHEFFCARCRLEIEPGAASVRCPACGVWYHQSAERGCWTYAPTCALCPQPSALDAGFRWTPEEP